MTGKLLLLLLAAAALAVPPAADAAGRGLRVFAQEEGRHFRKDAGSFPQGERNARRDKRGEHRHGRLTEEERRELHRDLDRAHREIYRPKRP